MNGQVFLHSFFLFLMSQSLLWSPEVISSFAVNAGSLPLMTGWQDPECFLTPNPAQLPTPPPGPAPEQSTNIFTDANSGVLRISGQLFFLWAYSPEWNYQVRGYEQFYGSYYMSLDCCLERLSQFRELPTAYLSIQSC